MGVHRPSLDSLFPSGNIPCTIRTSTDSESPQSHQASMGKVLSTSKTHDKRLFFIAIVIVLITVLLVSWTVLFVRSYLSKMPELLNASDGPSCGAVSVPLIAFDEQEKRDTLIQLIQSTTTPAYNSTEAIAKVFYNVCMQNQSVEDSRQGMWMLLDHYFNIKKPNLMSINTKPREKLLANLQITENINWPFSARYLSNNKTLLISVPNFSYTTKDAHIDAIKSFFALLSHDTNDTTPHVRNAALSVANLYDLSRQASLSSKRHNGNLVSHNVSWLVSTLTTSTFDGQTFVREIAKLIGVLQVDDITLLVENPEYIERWTKLPGAFAHSLMWSLIESQTAYLAHEFQAILMPFGVQITSPEVLLNKCAEYGVQLVTHMPVDAKNTSDWQVLVENALDLYYILSSALPERQRCFAEPLKPAAEMIFFISRAKQWLSARARGCDMADPTLLGVKACLSSVHLS